MRFASRGLAAMIVATGLAGGAAAQQPGAKSGLRDPYSRALQTYQFKKAAAYRLSSSFIHQ